MDMNWPPGTWGVCGGTWRCRGRRGGEGSRLRVTELFVGRVAEARLGGGWAGQGEGEGLVQR